MGKKRKAGGKPFAQTGPRKIDEADAKLRVNTYEDVADSEDEFHINRDKILLGENSQQKKRRKLQEEEEFLEPSDEEVLAEEASLAESDDVDDDSQDVNGAQSSVPKGPQKVLWPEESDQSGDKEEEDLGDWGTSKRDYYNADTIETEADALEEEVEARRLQQKRLQGLTEADFGFIGKKDWLKSGKEDGEGDGSERDSIIQEVLPQVEITDAMGPEERSKMMKVRYPEFEPLATEFLELQSLHERLGLAAAAADAIRKYDNFPTQSSNGQSDSQSISRKTPIAVIKYSALTAYLASLSMYFALLTSPASRPDGSALAMPPIELREHTVMESLMKCRELWSKVKDLQIPDLIDQSPILNGLGSGMAEARQITSTSKPSKDGGDKDLIVAKRKKSRKSKAKRAAETAQLEADARRAERIRQTEEALAGLSALAGGVTKKPARTLLTTNKPQANEDDSDFGEQTTLTPYEAAEKAKRKKTLSFYTSQIAQKANKRDAAGRDAGGDADLPYRERLKDRVVRLNAEAEARGKKPKDSTGDQLGGESDEEDRRAAAELREDRNGSEDGYYDLVAASSRKKKADKKALAAVQSQAAKEGGTVHVVEEVGPDGKRAITYAIEKNKGLAPKRKKDVRNPRVKKRKKYEEKKKKLGSVRQVYKGGEGRGGYGGELTGIKKGLVKSIKL